MNGACAAGDPEFGKLMRPSGAAAGCGETTGAADNAESAKDAGSAIAASRKKTPRSVGGTRESYPVPLHVPRRNAFRVAPAACRARLELERVPEHQLRDAHEPGLRVGLAEVRVAEVVGALQRAHVDAVEQVQHLDLDLGLMRTENAEVL